MSGFGDIVGQESVIARLRGALAAGRPHHAYLFDGPEGVGKRRAATAFAQALNCERQPGEGCGACESCRKIDAGLHPDVIGFDVLPEKGQSERVRDFIPRLAFPPHEGRARVVVLDPAHELNLTASNVLLKTLEEPPARTHFVLVSPVASSLLVTIRSRCQRLRFVALPAALLAEQLVAAHGVAPAQAATIAGLAGGSFSRALALLSSDEVGSRAELAGRLAAAAQTGGAAAALELAAEMGDRDETEATLDLLWLLYREALLCASGVAAGRVASERLATAEQLARVGADRLLLALHAVDEARDAVRGYVGPQLVVEHLLLRLGRSGAAVGA